eukprot:4745525-Alexandrium_andersonii.AAC.1
MAKLLENGHAARLAAAGSGSALALCCTVILGIEGNQLWQELVADLLLQRCEGLHSNVQHAVLILQAGQHLIALQQQLLCHIHFFSCSFAGLGQDWRWRRWGRWRRGGVLLPPAARRLGTGHLSLSPCRCRARGGRCAARCLVCLSPVNPPGRRAWLASATTRNSQRFTPRNPMEWATLRQFGTGAATNGDKWPRWTTWTTT